MRKITRREMLRLLPSLLLWLVACDNSSPTSVITTPTVTPKPTTAPKPRKTPRVPSPQTVTPTIIGKYMDIVGALKPRAIGLGEFHPNKFTPFEESVRYLILEHLLPPLMEMGYKHLIWEGLPTGTPDEIDYIQKKGSLDLGGMNFQQIALYILTNRQLPPSKTKHLNAALTTHAIPRDSLRFLERLTQLGFVLHPGGQNIETELYYLENPPNNRYEIYKATTPEITENTREGIIQLIGKGENPISLNGVAHNNIFPGPLNDAVRTFFGRDLIERNTNYLETDVFSADFINNYMIPDQRRVLLPYQLTQLIHALTKEGLLGDVSSIYKDGSGAVYYNSNPREPRTVIDFGNFLGD